MHRLSQDYWLSTGSDDRSEKGGGGHRIHNQVQNQFIENAEFLAWRGRLLIYNANLDKGKLYLREALNKDPDNVDFQKGWKNVQKLKKVKKEGKDAF
jgi:hypothetical protein